MKSLIIVLISNTAYCPHCAGIKVTRKEDSGRVARWNCDDGKSSFNVLSGTIIKLRVLTERAIGRCFGVQLAKLKRVLTSAVLLRFINGFMRYTDEPFVLTGGGHHHLVID